MSSIKTPSKPFSERALFWALLPWPAVAAGLFVFHSAFLAFLFYATVCLLGAGRLEGFACRWRPKWPLRVHLGVALVSNLVLVGLYLLVGKWVLPAGLLLERLAGVGITTASFVWLFPYFFLVNPTVEELFWRGSIRTAWSPVAFAAWHSLPVFLVTPVWIALPAVLGIMAVGYALERVVSQTRTLGDAILLHALGADLPLLILVWIASRP